WGPRRARCGDGVSIRRRCAASYSTRGWGGARRATQPAGVGCCAASYSTRGGRGWGRRLRGGLLRGGGGGAAGLAALARALDERVERRQHDERQHGRRDEAADHDDRERLRDEAAVPREPHRERQQGEDRR